MPTDIESTILDQSSQRKNTLKIAIILFRFVRSDGEAKMLELMHMSEILRKDFSLTQGELEEVFKLADRIDKKGESTEDILVAVRDQWSAQDRAKLLEYLWIIAFADDKIDAKETGLIETIASQLGLSRMDQARSQEKAETHLGL